MERTRGPYNTAARLLESSNQVQNSPAANPRQRKARGSRPAKLTPKRRRRDPPETPNIDEVQSENEHDSMEGAITLVIDAPVVGEVDGVVPESNRTDFGVDEGREEEDDSDRVVPPGEDNEECELDEELCEDIRAEFGVAVDEGEQNVDGEDDSDADFIDEDDIPAPRVASDDEEDIPNTGQGDGAFTDLLSLGKCFATVEDFKIAVLKYSLRSRYDLKLYRSESLRVGAKCNDKDKQCQWRVYAAYDKRLQKMQIKVFVEAHTCVRSGYSNLLKQGAIVYLFRERLRGNPKLTKQEMAAEILREYNLVVSDEICSKAKTYLASERKQSHESHFAKIWDYQAEVLRSNEESTFEIETIPGPVIGSKQRFHRLYMCFKSQKDAWRNTCRPILGFDGAFLKWDIKGHLLAAVGRDGDNRIVPIAWAIVEGESEPNWTWFVRLVSVDLGLEDGRSVAVISDKQRGLVNAFHNLLPRAEHRQCARHIMDNWKRDSHDMELQRLFWKIARSYNQGEFSANMDALMRYSPRCYETLLVTTPATWSRAFFRVGSYCGDVLNNLCESFNKTIRAARRKPILELLEDIRRQCMVRTERRFLAAVKLESRFTKKAHEEIERMVAGSQACTRFMARNDLHEVRVGGISYTVNMNDHTCGCMKWQLTGIPCIHGAAVIIGKREKVEDYVSEFYTTEMLRKPYEYGIKPVQGELLWARLNKLPVLPPPWRPANPGRPSNYARKKGANEASQPSSKLSKDGRVMKCSNCLQDGHNKKTCKNQKVNAPPKKRRGRPKKSQGQNNEGQNSQPGASQVRPRASQSEASHVQQSQSGVWRAWANRHGGSQVQAASWRPWDDQVGASHTGTSQAGASQAGTSQAGAYQDGDYMSNWIRLVFD